MSADDALASDVAAFAVHPALLDAGLHPSFLGAELRVPFSWRGVRVHGPGAATLRVRVVRTGDDLAVTAFDTTGAPVLSVDEVIGRPIDPRSWRPGAPLYALEWRALETTPEASDDEVAVVPLLGDDAPDDPVAATHAQVERMLGVLQVALAGEGRLGVLGERGARRPRQRAAGPGRRAAVWGLVRSAQSEHPGRIVLVDTDDRDDRAVGGACLATDEPQVALPRRRPATRPRAGPGADRATRRDAATPRAPRHRPRRHAADHRRHRRPRRDPRPPPRRPGPARACCWSAAAARTRPAPTRW